MEIIDSAIDCIEEMEIILVEYGRRLAALEEKLHTARKALEETTKIYKHAEMSLSTSAAHMYVLAEKAIAKICVGQKVGE